MPFRLLGIFLSPVCPRGRGRPGRTSPTFFLGPSPLPPPPDGRLVGWPPEPSGLILAADPAGGADSEIPPPPHQGGKGGNHKEVPKKSLISLICLWLSKKSIAFLVRSKIFDPYLGEILGSAVP